MKETGDEENEKKGNSDGVKTCRNLQREKQKPRLDVFLEVSSSLYPSFDRFSFFSVHPSLDLSLVLESRGVEQCAVGWAVEVAASTAGLYEERGL